MRPHSLPSACHQQCLCSGSISHARPASHNLQAGSLLPLACQLRLPFCSRYDDLVAAGGEKAAKEAGKLRVEGKDYVVQEADVLLFRTSA